MIVLVFIQLGKTAKKIENLTCNILQPVKLPRVVLGWTKLTFVSTTVASRASLSSLENNSSTLYSASSLMIVTQDLSLMWRTPNVYDLQRSNRNDTDIAIRSIKVPRITRFSCKLVLPKTNNQLADCAGQLVSRPWSLAPLKVLKKLAYGGRQLFDSQDTFHGQSTTSLLNMASVKYNLGFSLTIRIMLSDLSEEM